MRGLVGAVFCSGLTLAQTVVVGVSPFRPGQSLDKSEGYIGMALTRLVELTVLEVDGVRPSEAARAVDGCKIGGLIGKANGQYRLTFDSGRSIGMHFPRLV